MTSSRDASAEADYRAAKAAGDCDWTDAEDDGVDQYVVHAPGATCPAGPQHLGPCTG